MRSIIIATVIAAVLAMGAHVTAQTKPASFPMEIKGKPGVNVMAFLNNGKLGEGTLGSDGLLSSIIDVSNLGKVKLTTYVDVCKDGEMVKVMVASGAPAPEDEGCSRRIVGVPFFSDCGATRFTVDITLMLTQVTGCGGGLTRNKLVLITGAIATGGLVAIAGAGGDSTAAVNTTPPQVATSANTNVAAPPVTQQPPAPPTQQPTAPAPPPPATANGSYGLVSCGVKLDPAAHNLTLFLCEVLRQLFAVLEGPFSISHPAPFITVTGATYNATTGAFDITGTGSIAGFNGVAARAVGTVNLQTGTITFDYTLGSNGVFPRGQPITYSITLQKR